MSESKQRINNDIYEGLTENVIKRKPGNERRQSSSVWHDVALFESFRSGEVKFDDIDLEKQTHAFRQDERFDRAYRMIEDGSAFDRVSGRQEEIYEAMALSQYGDFVNACVQMGTFELCGSPDFAPILSMFGREDVDCVNRDRWTLPALADFEPPCVTEDSRLKYFQLGDIVRWCMPEPVEKAMGVQMKRNMICLDQNGALRELLRNQVAEVFRRWAVRLLLKELFSCICCGSDYPPCYDGITYEPFLGCTGPWCNKYYNTDSFQCPCQHPAICAIENMMEDMVNPVTGLPMECGTGLDVLSTGQKQARYIRQLLGPQLSLRPDTDCAGSCEIPRQQRDGWGSIMNNKIIRQEVRKCACDAAANLGLVGDEADTAADQIVDRTFVAGNFREALVWQVRWDTNTYEMSGTDTDAYHREGIVFSLRADCWAGPAWKNPWAVFASVGLPDGTAAPVDPCVDPNPLCV